MAAPDTDVSAQLELNKTPVKLEDLPKEELAPEEPRPPWKGVLVQCAKLWSYLSGISTFERANMLRKGREVHKIYVEVMKGKTFLDDQFALTEFGRMVLQNGTIRAGRAKNAKQIVVARETLYCSGSGVCKRGCGGYGECVPGCEKTKMRGHKCSYRVKLTMRLGYVNYWFVEVLGDHEQFTSLTDSSQLSDSSTPTPTKCVKNGSSPPRSPNQCASPAVSGAEQLPNNDLPKNSSANGIAILRQDILPNILNNALSNHLPNTGTLLASQPMSLPINLPNNLPIVSQTGIFPTHSSIGLFNVNGASPCELVYQKVEGIGENYCQDRPISLVKVKKEPDESTDDQQDKNPSFIATPSVDNAVAMPTSGTSSPVVSESTENTSSKTGSRAKARKRFHPSQVVSGRDNVHRQLVPHTVAELAGETGVYKSNLESHVRKELRELVARREMDRNISNSQCNDSQMNDDNWQNMANSVSQDGEENSAYTYVWDGEIIDGQGEDVSMETAENEDKVARIRTKHVHGVGLRMGKDLITRVRQLETHVNQLRNVVLKSQSDGSQQCKQGRKQKQREFDFKKYNTRHVALKILYLGWDYHGFAVQEDTDKTIESALFEALTKTKLIETRTENGRQNNFERETSNYHRCGRTDKGVSAFGQVISIDLRTNLLEGPGVKVREDGSAYDRPGDKTTEIRYVHILNKVLPKEIQVLAWAPVDVNFSARFDCKKRTYKYFFPRGSLDLQSMSDAAEKLIGEHDFRNLCKMDVGNGVVNYMRKIVSAEIVTLDERENGYQMCELTIVGLAFLWHQIRCIVAVLYLIGQGKEKPEIIDELLDIEKNPRKPQYTMASELPLVLFDTEFSDDVEWIYEADWHEENIRHLQQLWAQHTVRSTMLRRMLEEMDCAKVETDCDIAPWRDLSAPILNQHEWIIPSKAKTYKRLLDRQTCDSLEQRMEHYAKKRKANTPTTTEPDTDATAEATSIDEEIS